MIDIRFTCDGSLCEVSRVFRLDNIEPIRPAVDVLIKDGWLFVRNPSLEKTEGFCPAHAPAREAILKAEQEKWRAEDVERGLRRRLSWAKFDAENPDLVGQRCHADDDGDCKWQLCPQNRDKEPATSSRHCPLDRLSADDEA
jgi:hypothetical protein